MANLRMGKPLIVMIIMQHIRRDFFEPLIQVMEKIQQFHDLGIRFPAKFQYDTKIYF